MTGCLLIHSRYFIFLHSQVIQQWNTVTPQIRVLAGQTIPNSTQQQISCSDFLQTQYPINLVDNLLFTDYNTLKLFAEHCLLEMEMIIWTLSEKCKQLHPFNMGLKYSS